MSLAERIAMKEALLKLPDTQTREIFSVALSERAKIPFIRLPDSENLPPSSSQLNDNTSRQYNQESDEDQVIADDEDEESDDSDVEDVEELFLELAQELDSEDKVTQQRLTRVAKEQHDQTAPPSSISLPQSVFTFPSNDYFSPGAPFLTSTGSPMTPQPEKRHRTSSVICTPTTEPDPPTINVRIAGGDIIQDVFLSPIVERPPSTPHHRNNSWIEHETYQTRSDEEHLLHGVHPFSLRPPPHLMRSRRQSKTTQHGLIDGRPFNLQQQVSSTSTLSDGPENKSQASSKNSSTSAVSPRFMALRKLSESGLIAPYAKPPPPPPPPTAHSSSENSSIAPDTTDLNFNNLNEQRLLDRIDEIIESRLKSNISEILWRATESHRDARRFWEEQRRDMLELGSSILHKLSSTADQLKQHRQGSGEDVEEEEEQELDNLRKLRIDLENEVSGYQLKHVAQQTEIQSIQQRYIELEKEVETFRLRNSELEAQLVQHQRNNGVTVKDTRLSSSSKASTKTRDVQTENISTIMDWADVVAEDEWAKKYSNLETKYEVANNKIAELEKQLLMQQQQHHQQQRPTSRSAVTRPLNQTRPASSMALVAPSPSSTNSTTATITTRATSPSNAATIKQRKHKSMTPAPSHNHINKERKASHRQSYFMNEDGHLTFTTEINGQLSQYTVKLPSKEDSNTHTTNTSNSTKLNPLAQSWKTPTTMST
ncbi:hypothetical protein BDC45DRAFT_529346 [Circinella umbellata]|nr:hypothetical protein BDC45DRAFT_529346 [Circinella umbellata]